MSSDYEKTVYRIVEAADRAAADNGFHGIFRNPLNGALTNLGSALCRAVDDILSEADAGHYFE